MRHEITALLEAPGVVTAGNTMTVHIPICDDAGDPEFAVASLYDGGVLLVSEDMKRMPDPLHGRLVYVLADPEKRDRPATRIEGTINEYVNAVIHRGEGPLASPTAER